MIPILKKYIKGLILLMLTIGLVHFLILVSWHELLGISKAMFYEIYAFLFFLNLLNFFALQWLFLKWPKYAGFLFSALSMVKMAFAILFIIPFILPAKPNSISFVINFMMVYFATLFFEVYFIAKNPVKS